MDLGQPLYNLCSLNFVKSPIGAPKEKNVLLKQYSPDWFEWLLLLKSYWFLSTLTTEQIQI